MRGVAEEWRPGRGRRPGWGTLSGRDDCSADGIRGPGGGGGPNGGRGSAAAAAAAAPNAPSRASGLGLRLRLRDPKESSSSLRRCRSSSCRCRRRRCCSCCHSPRPGPGRRQLQSLPGPRLHPRVGVAIPRRAGRAGGQRGHSSQARAERLRPALRRPPAAVWVLTLILRGARAPGGASLPVPSPHPVGTLGLGFSVRTARLCVLAPSPPLPTARHKSQERPTGQPQPQPRAPGESQLARCNAPRPRGWGQTGWAKSLAYSDAPAWRRLVLVLTAGLLFPLDSLL